MSDALALLHGLVLDNGRRWGEAAETWQRDDAAAVLEPDEGDPRLHWVGRPKGASKSTDVSGMSLAWLLEQAPALAEGYVIASDGDQANRLLNKGRGFVERTPGLKGRVRVEASRLVGPNGAYVEALAADEAGAQDLLTPWIVVDEVANWKTTQTAQGMWTAAFSAVPKWPGMRLVVLTFAGDPSHWSHKVRERAEASPRWRMRELPGPCPWMSPDDLDEQRALLLPSQYVRRHENRWVSGEDRLSTLDDVRECVRHVGVLAPRAGVRYCIGLDIGLTNDRTVVTVGHPELADDDSTMVVVDRQEVWQGTRDDPVPLADVEAFILEASRAYNRAPLIFDPFQAAHVTQRLRRLGVRVVEFVFSQQSIGRMTVTLFRLLRDALLDLPDEPGLIDELASVRLLEPAPGIFRVDHDAGKHDDRVISLGLVAHHLIDRGSRGRKSHFRDGTSSEPSRPPAEAKPAAITGGAGPPGPLPTADQLAEIIRRETR